MGRQLWGKTAGALVLAVTVAAVSGCGSSSDEDDSKPAAKEVGIGEATTKFQTAVTKFDEDGGCPEKEPGTCWDQMQALMGPARTLRKAMNAHKGTGPGFWSDAYALIDKMEKGMAVGEDQGAEALTTNRPVVFGTAHVLSRWLDAHPVS
ncbi:hypothetical protein ACIRP3_00525 [Streptomyces sp. NPDC101209]|uniref:hypothetical protein n=1 Tax=Streptomyces sp. NPDC101209 TaxID=3366129 RepID=UPI003829D668